MVGGGSYLARFERHPAPRGLFSLRWACRRPTYRLAACTTCTGIFTLPKRRYSGTPIESTPVRYPVSEDQYVEKATAPNVTFNTGRHAIPHKLHEMRRAVRCTAFSPAGGGECAPRRFRSSVTGLAEVVRAAAPSYRMLSSSRLASVAVSCRFRLHQASTSLISDASRRSCGRGVRSAWKDHQHLVHKALYRFHALRTPRPQLRRDVQTIELSQECRHQSKGMGKSMATKTSGLRFAGRCDELLQHPVRPRQHAHCFGETSHREPAERRGAAPLLFHAPAAKSEHLDGSAPKSGDERTGA